MEVYAYVRVSSKDQNEDRQIIEMIKNGISTKNIFIDKASGKNFNRPNYKRMINCLCKGDLLYIKSIDRLGRNYEGIIDQWKHITKTLECDIIVLDMPLLNTMQCKDLLGTFISDIVLQILSFVAENERSVIKERQKEGIFAAKLRGVKFGRPPKNLPDQIFEDYIASKKNVNQITREYQISCSTFYRKLKKYKSKKSESTC